MDSQKNKKKFTEKFQNSKNYLKSYKQSKFFEKTEVRKTYTHSKTLGKKKTERKMSEPADQATQEKKGK